MSRATIAAAASERVCAGPAPASLAVFPPASAGGIRPGASPTTSAASDTLPTAPRPPCRQSNSDSAAGRSTSPSPSVARARHHQGVAHRPAGSEMQNRFIHAQFRNRQSFSAGSCLGFLSFAGTGTGSGTGPAAAAAGKGRSTLRVKTHATESTMERTDFARTANTGGSGRRRCNLI